MISCKICNTENSEGTSICTVCSYPLKGTEQEQAAYVAKQVTQKSDVMESIGRLKTSRAILFALGAFYIIIPFTPFYGSNSFVAIAISAILGLIFIGFGFLTFKKPKIALLIPLSLTIFYYVILLLISPMLLWVGILWKMIVLMGLGYGYISVRKSQRILKENTYLASLLGYDFGKIN